MTFAETILARLRTRPLELIELSEIFGCSPRSIRSIVEGIPGIQKVGRRFRVPILEMPAEWLIASGLLQSAELGKTLQGSEKPIREPGNCDTLKP